MIAKEGLDLRHGGGEPLGLVAADRCDGLGCVAAPHRLVRMRTAWHPVSGESLPGTSAATGDGPGGAHQGASLRTAASMPGGT